MTPRDELQERMAEWNCLDAAMTPAQRLDFTRRLERLSDREVIELLARALARRRRRKQ